MANKRNTEGYPDPTAYGALSKIEREEAHAKKMRSILGEVCEMSGYRIQGKLILMDKRTGYTYKL
jgi:hypothetical protein